MQVGYSGSFRSTSEPLWLIRSKEETLLLDFFILLVQQLQLEQMLK